MVLAFFCGQRQSIDEVRLGSSVYVDEGVCYSRFIREVSGSYTLERNFDYDVVYCGDFSKTIRDVRVRDNGTPAGTVAFEGAIDADFIRVCDRKFTGTDTYLIPVWELYEREYISSGRNPGRLLFVPASEWLARYKLDYFDDEYCQRVAEIIRMDSGH
jgi:hypothetical protein